jgi:hypothetical protein
MRGALRFGPLAICVLAIPIIFLLTKPFVEIGANDDWQYTRMAKVWAETGGLHYDGWGLAMVGPHAFWGMAVVKLFGFSFSALRASMIPIDAGCAALMYLIASWIGLSRWSSALASLGLVSSPLFVPLATVFMTDVSGLFLFLLTVYCALRAAGSARRDYAALWLGGAAIAGVLAGAVRQNFWGAPLLMIAAFAFLRRKDRLLAAASLGMLALTALAIAICLHWLYSQPFTYQVPMRIPQNMREIQSTIFHVITMVLTIALFCLPAILYLLGRRPAWRGAAFVLLGTIGFVAAAGLGFPRLLRAPWTGNIVTTIGLLFPNEVIVGDRPVILTEPVRYVIGTLVWIVMLFAAITLIRLRSTWNSNGRLEIFWWLVLPYSLAYLTIVVVRSLDTFFTDRYLLPLVAVGAIGIVAVAERLPGERFAAFSWAAVLVMGAYAVSTTHDAFRLWEARANATDQLTRSGIERECIMGGYEYDLWTERQHSDHFVLPENLPARDTPVDYYFFRSLPHVKPKYYLVTSPQRKLSGVLDIPYSTWFAPRERHLLVEADPGGSCGK